MSKLPVSSEPVEVLVRAHGLSQPAAAFSAALTRQVVARYASAPRESFAAGAWLGKVIMGVLSCLALILLGIFSRSLGVVVGTSLLAGLVGAAGLVGLLEHQRKRFPQRAIFG